VGLRYGSGNAIDPYTGQVCASMVGRRKERGFLHLPALVAPFGITLFSTDGWGPTSVMGTRSTMPVARNPGSA